MYLQIGTEDFIKTENIIGIFDLDNTTVSKTSRDYLNFAEKQKLSKSFIVTEEKGKRTVYISPYSTNTLFKRID